MHKTRRYVALSVIGSLAIILGAVAIASYYIHRVDERERASLQRQAQDAALLVTPSDIAALSADDSDLTKPVYVRIKENLTAFRNYNPDIRFVYILGYHPDLKIQFFYVDSEPASSEDYSPPGQLYGDTRPEDIEHYSAGKPYTDGPYKDSWGEWVSGYAPIIDVDGNVQALVGIDIATTVWHDQTRFIAVTASFIALLLLVLYIILLRMFWKRDFSIFELSGKNRELELNRKTLDEIRELGRLGVIALYFDNDTVKIDERLAQLFGSSSFSLGHFLSRIHSDDRTGVEDAINEMRHSDNAYTWFDARFGTPEEGYRTYHIYGAIEHGDNPRFSGIMQDVTDLKR
jgi:hypothetical protein